MVLKDMCHVYMAPSQKCPQSAPEGFFLSALRGTHFPVPCILHTCLAVPLGAPEGFNYFSIISHFLFTFVNFWFIIV